MKTITYSLILGLISSPLWASDDFEKDLEKYNKKPTEDKEQALQHFTKGTTKVAGDQDELSADVQDLIQEQTDEKVIELLEQAEELMAQATDKLDQRDTSGTTIAIETEIIERISDAAKQRKQSSSSPGEGNQASDALMDMMQEMLGDKPGDKPGKKGEGNKGGEGQTAESDTATSSNQGDSDGEKSTRRVPKNAGSTGATVPLEFRKALDSYNKSNK